MERSVKAMLGFTIRAVDGDIGKVDDFYFDDQTWVIRYLIDRTGGMWKGRQVLIPPAGFDGPPDWDAGVFPLTMTKEKVRNSPGLSFDEPVSRQKERELLSYYGMPMYWQYFSTQTLPPIPVIPPIPEETFEEISREARGGERAQAKAPDTHLRSASEVIGYSVRALDGRIGAVRDLSVSDEDWSIRHVVVDINSWLPGGNASVERASVDGVSWTDSQLSVKLTVHQVRELAGKA